MLTNYTRRVVAAVLVALAISLGAACGSGGGSDGRVRTSTTDLNGSVTSGPAQQAPVDVSPG